MTTFIRVAVVVLLAAVATPVAADELPVGTWTGFIVRLNRNNQNRQAAVLAVRKVPDPHVAWRGGSGELTSLVFGNPNNNLANAFEVTSVTFGDGRLTFSFTPPDSDQPAECALTLQPRDGTYVGDCVGYNRRVTLTPPKPAADLAKPTAPAK